MGAAAEVGFPVAFQEGESVLEFLESDCATDFLSEQSIDVRVLNKNNKIKLRQLEINLAANQVRWQEL